MHFQVKSITVRTADRARSLRARRHPELDVFAEMAKVDGGTVNVNTPGFSVEDDSGVSNLDGLAHASLAEASIRQIPEKVEEMALSKMLPVDLAA
eukprot:4361263-Amphidinium_carterae.1